MLALSSSQHLDLLESLYLAQQNTGIARIDISIDWQKTYVVKTPSETSRPQRFGAPGPS
jgi:hypothetical protein